MSTTLPPIAIMTSESRPLEHDTFDDCPSDESNIPSWLDTLSSERRARFLRERSLKPVSCPHVLDVGASPSTSGSRNDSKAQPLASLDRKRKRDAEGEAGPSTQAPIDSEGEDELEDDVDAEADDPDDSAAQGNATAQETTRIPALRRARPPTTSAVYTPPPRNAALTASIVLGDQYDGEYGDALSFKVGQRELGGTWYYVLDWKKQKTWPTDETRPETVPVVFQRDDDPEAASNLEYDTHAGCLACQIANLPCVQDYAQVKKCWRCETSRQCCTLQYMTYGHPDAGGIPNRFLSSAKKVGVAWRHDQYVLLKKREKCRWIPVYFQPDEVDERAKKIIQARVMKHSGTVERAAKRPRHADGHREPASYPAPATGLSPATDVNHQPIFQKAASPMAPNRHHDAASPRFAGVGVSYALSPHPQPNNVPTPRNPPHTHSRGQYSLSSSSGRSSPEYASTPLSVRDNLLKISRSLGEASWSLFSGTGLDGPRSLHEDCREIALKILAGQRDLDNVIKRLGDVPPETEGRERMRAAGDDSSLRQ